MPADAKEEIHEVLDGLRKRAMSISATICKLLLQFKAAGYKFTDEAE